MKTSPRNAFFGIIFILVAVCLSVSLAMRMRKGAVKSGAQAPAQTVAVAKVTRADLAQTLGLDAEFRPYQEVSIHAKVAGYVQKINVDIGDRVKTGDALAVLEIPELKDQLNAAIAQVGVSQEEVKRAEADYEDTHAVYQRLLQVAQEHPKLVAQQDVDTARDKEGAMKGALGSAQQHVVECQANQRRLQTMLDYASIAAPFDGVVTKRYADTGALVQAGTASSTQAMPVVDLQEDDILRLIFPVPESAVPHIKVGLPVEITVEALDETFQGTVTRDAGKIDRATRTMDTEVDVPNPSGKLKPGMYASVKITLDQRRNVLSVPLQALSFGKTTSAIVLNEDGRLEERTVAIGLETASRAEIRSGLKENELVVVGNRSGIEPGQRAAGKFIDSASIR